MEPDLKQKPDPKDDINPKYTPEGGANIADDLGPGTASGEDAGVGTPGDSRKPYKVK